MPDLLMGIRTASAQAELVRDFLLRFGKLVNLMDLSESFRLKRGAAAGAEEGFFFEGHICKLQLYQGALSPEEVKWMGKN